VREHVSTIRITIFHIFQKGSAHMDFLYACEYLRSCGADAASDL
jgi:hypothetical protein